MTLLKSTSQCLCIYSIVSERCKCELENKVHVTTAATKHLLFPFLLSLKAICFDQYSKKLKKNNFDRFISKMLNETYA